jgi:GntR family galactonate operon transcriptional repressor
MTIPSAPGVSSRRGLHRVVVHHLGLRIVRGELGAGATLPTEADLSTELGVSRTVIREAIKVLAAKGLVESRPKTGTRALGRTHWSLVDPDVLAWQVQVGPDPAFFADLVEVRDFIEPRAAEIAAERATPEERATLMRLQEEMEAADVDAAASMRVDLALHAAILRATHNGLLAQMTEAIITALGASLVSAFRASGGPESTNRAHRLVVEAIGRGDPAGARESMEALIASTAREAGRVITATDVDGRSATGRNT